MTTPKSNKVFLRSLSAIGACEEAREWAKGHGGNFAELWRDCERGDWMAWYIGRTAKTEAEKRRMVGVLADCAALSLKYYEKQYPNDKRVRECIAVCRRYARGKATREELECAAAYAAYAAANAAAYAAYAAAYAAYAAANAANAAAYSAYSAYAAYAAAYAANAAANAAAYDANAAAYAADAAAYSARSKTLKKCADIFRKHYPEMMEGA